MQHIELLRGPQGTLYGRNAMSGIINVFTYSPLDYERTKISLTAGNYGLLRGNASISRKIGQKAGVTFSGYYDGNDGFFENQYDGKRANSLLAAGGRFRFDLQPSENLTMRLIANYDHSEQGAFPYGKYENGKIADPDYDYAGRYVRKMAGSNFNLQFKNDKIVFNSTTGFQYFDDDMHMDLDYTRESIFTNNQLQKERNWTQEFAVKSNTRNDYQWSFGAFGFSRNLTTNVTTTMRQGAIDNILQPVLNDAMRPMRVEITDTEIPIRGTFKMPAYGAAIFHQSTYNNLFVDNLSLTAGIRLDYEKAELEYHSSMTMNMSLIPPGPPMQIRSSVETEPVGLGTTSFTEWLPKVALKYTFYSERYVYASVAKGHKAGGYNIQMFADITRDIIEEKGKRSRPPGLAPGELIEQELPEAILPAVTYRPEHSWNYEIGFKGYVIGNTLHTEAAVFLIDVNDILITDFAESGQGRLLKNAGRARSAGLDLGLTAYLLDNNLTLSLNYGYAHATFKDYKPYEVDYSGNYIPFAPQNTFSLAAGYNRGLRNSRIIDRFNIHAQYNGAGKIYWTEANDVSQNLYGLLNLRAGVSKGVFRLNLWTKNTLNTNYAAFSFITRDYINNSDLPLAQRGAPFQMGIDLSVLF